MGIMWCIPIVSTVLSCSAFSTVSLTEDSAMQILWHCLACGKEIQDGSGITVGVDGDKVCNTACFNQRQQEMNTMAAMSDKEFRKWLLGDLYGSVFDKGVRP